MMYENTLTCSLSSASRTSLPESSLSPNRPAILLIRARCDRPGRPPSRALSRSRVSESTSSTEVAISPRVPIRSISCCSIFRLANSCCCSSNCWRSCSNCSSASSCCSRALWASDLSRLSEAWSMLSAAPCRDWAASGSSVISSARRRVRRSSSSCSGASSGVCCSCLRSLSNASSSDPSRASSALCRASAAALCSALARCP